MLMRRDADKSEKNKKKWDSKGRSGSEIRRAAVVGGLEVPPRKGGG